MAATVAGRPTSDYADNWCSLFELFVSVSGLKLRLNVPDTVIVKNGRMLGWFYTNKEGVVSRCALHEINPSLLFQKLVGSATLDEGTNPYRYVALCHFESGVSRPLKQEELQHLLASLVGPYDVAKPPLDPSADTPFCIQAYIIPMRDLRYLTAFGGTEQASCISFARKFSGRYTHISDGPSPAVQASFTPEDAETSTLTSDELVVESQLIAMGLLEPRHPQGQEGDEVEESWGGSDTQAAQSSTLPTSKKSKAELTRTIQALVSYVERAHGLRIQGLVAEFVQAHPDVFVLLAVHAVQWDGRASRGRLGTFTERWQDYTNGLGPAPAAQPPSRSGNAPGLLLSNDNKMVIMTERSKPQSALIGSHDAWSQRASLGRSPVLHHSLTQSMADGHVVDARPGSAPAQLVQRLRPATAGFAGPRNGNSTLRSALATARRGAGGNPGAVAPVADSYALFTPRQGLSTDTMLGSLILEVEVLKERLQRQTDVAVRAEAALTQLAFTGQQTQAGLLKQLGEARVAAEQAAEGRSQIEAEYERLYHERGALNSRITTLENELSSAQSALADDRATLANTVRMSNNKQDGLEDLLARLRADNESLNSQVGSLQRRLEEEGEVVEAARNQLYEYKQMVGTLQSQLRRGKNKPAGTLMPGVSASVTSLTGMGGFPPSNHLSTSVAGNFDGTLELPTPEVAADALKQGISAKRPGNSPLNPARTRLAGKLDAQPRRSTDGGSAPLMSHPILRLEAEKADVSAQRRSNRASQSGFVSESGEAPLSPKQRAKQAGQYQNATSKYLSAAIEQASSKASPAALSRLSDKSADLVHNEIASQRRARKHGSADLGVGTTGQAATALGAEASSKTVVTLQEKKLRVKNPWTPNYDSLHLNDLFIITGDLSERMGETLGHLLVMLQSFESELLEIFNYYASLGQIKYVDDKLKMVEHQFQKLARNAGLELGSQMDAAEDAFFLVAERVTSYYSDSSKTCFLTFPEFPEVVCRLAAARYDWRAPENPDEADDDIEQPEALRTVPLANISELPNANLYGVGPTSRPNASTRQMPSPAESQANLNKLQQAYARAAEEGRDDVVVALCELGPQPPDVVLYTMIKTFIVFDLLPNAKVNNTMGSKISKQKSQSRTIPDGVWA